MRIFICVYIFLPAVFLTDAENYVAVSAKLRNHLLTNYTKHVVPVRRYHPVNVSYGLEIAQIPKFDNIEQFITLKTWTRQKWYNELLVWDPQVWNDIQELHFDPHDLWVPDILLLNTVGHVSPYGSDIYKNFITVRHDGFCRWINPVTFDVGCPVQLADFPYDVQTCTMTFLPYSSSTSDINLKIDPAPMLTEAYINSSQWNFLNTSKFILEHTFKCCPGEVFTEIHFQIRIARKPQYYVLNVIVPCLVLVSSILFGFYLPVESGERVALTITILLAVAVFLQIVSDSLPKNSDSMPVLSLFYMVVMTESACSLLMTCLVLSVHFHGDTANTRPVPEWARRVFFQGFGRWFGMLQPTTKVKSAVAYRKATGSINAACSGGMERSKSDVTNHAVGIREVVERLDQICSDLGRVSQTMIENEKEEIIDEEWRLLALILDRIFFFIFSFTIVITCLVIFLPPILNHPLHS